MCSHHWKTAAAFIALAISFAAAVAWGTHINREINHHDQDQIRQIQAGRLESCQRTYEGIRQAFQPFFARSPRPDVNTFNQHINALKAQCYKQIHAGSNP